MNQAQFIAHSRASSSSGSFRACLLILGTVLTATAQTHPHILVFPQDQPVCSGGSATFSVIATGAPPMTFLWYRDNTNVSEGVTSTQTNSFLTLTNVQFFDSFAQFQVLVTNLYGFAFSSNAAVVFSDPAIFQHPADLAVPTNSILSFHVIPCGSFPFSYQWFRGDPPLALTNGGRISGAHSEHLYISNTVPGDSDSYYVEVQNAWGSNVTSLKGHGFVGDPPTVTNLLSRVVRLGLNTDFVPTYTGDLPLFYQWYRNDVAIPGATSASLSLTNVKRPQVGLYHVMVANGAGSDVSDKAHLQVRLTLTGAPQVFLEEATDELSDLTNAQPSLNALTSVHHGVPLLFSTYNSTVQLWETNHCGLTATHTMWLVHFALRSESLKVSTEGSSFDTVVAVYTWTNRNLPPQQVGCSNDGGYDGKSSLFFFPAQANKDYYIAVGGVDGATGTVRLQVGETIRKPVYDPAKGLFRFELAGHYWFYNTLLSSTNLPVWTPLFTVPPAAEDWVIGYTNLAAGSEARRLYGVKVGATPP